MKKIKVIGILILLLFLVCGYLYVYKDHRNIATEKERFSMDVQTLFAVYQKNEIEADKKFLNETIVVNGIVSMLNKEDQVVVLNEKLVAVFSEKLANGIEIKSTVKIKGRLIGYDSLLEQLKMDQCVILN
jgi:hypothetical protein